MKYCFVICVGTQVFESNMVLNGLVGLSIDPNTLPIHVGTRIEARNRKKTKAKKTMLQ